VQIAHGEILSGSEFLETDGEIRCALMFRALLIVALFPALVTAHPPSQDATGDRALVITAPAAPGGGWDQTARAMQRVLAEIEPGASVQVDNVPGAAGTIGLARFIQSERGNPGALLVTGLVMVSGVIINGSPVSLADTTPIARLTGEYEVIVVPASSPFRSLGDLIDTFKKNPGSVSWGGGSAGGTDDLLVRLLAEQIGLPASSVNYIAFAGGGAALAAVLSGQLSAAVSGYAEFAGQIAAGQLRVLAVSSASRVSAIEAPTLRESGIALDLANWRAIVAPPGLSDAEQEALAARITKLATSSQWRAALAQNGWDDQLLTGPALRQFLLSEQARIEDVLRRLSATNARAPTTLAVTLTPASLPNAIAIAFFGVLALTLFKATKPSVVPDREGARMTAAIIIALLILPVVFMPLGFVSSSVLLFFVAASTLRAQPLTIRSAAFDLAVGMAFSITIFLVFTRGLGVALPGLPW
jgi:putative tricarboxylic transport membrane protein